jgi:hypothetical protein
MIEIEKIQLASTENDALVRTRVIIGREMVELQAGCKLYKTDRSPGFGKGVDLLEWRESVAALAS